jgi:hypothetical protein
LAASWCLPGPATPLLLRLLSIVPDLFATRVAALPGSIARTPGRLAAMTAPRRQQAE